MIKEHERVVLTAPVADAGLEAGGIDDAASRQLEQVVNEARLHHREVDVTAFA